jgi:hypothetical protein
LQVQEEIMDRRTLIKILGASTAAPASGLNGELALAQVKLAQVKEETSPRRFAWPFPESPETPPGSENQLPFGRRIPNGIEAQSGHALYTFPRDHRYYFGPIYHGPEYCEW